MYILSQNRNGEIVQSNKQFETRPLHHRETQQILPHDLKNDSLWINRSIYLAKRKSEEKNVKQIRSIFFRAYNVKKQNYNNIK